MHGEDWGVGVQACGGLALLFGDGGELHVVEERNFSAGWIVRVGAEHHGWSHALAVAALRWLLLLLLLLLFSQRQLALLFVLLVVLGRWWGSEFHDLNSLKKVSLSSILSYFNVIDLLLDCILL